ncbi:MAG: hypothetical protein CVU48_05430 [Candidatus Cloacimonetes bacterium HGW-Cloacimonetes-1]|jgi:peptidoglycan/xylan/chitin deacetylase (PgdA/CDA1 family)|nr:MAG: hypothetical protein CVU48_05430 [Candidatus Cloacimonetes bacterium HGW-Cloacimonetes-1]
MSFRYQILLIIIAATLSGCNIASNHHQGKVIVCLTFDDQDSSVYQVAVPIMEEFGYHGTLFVNSGNLGDAGKMSSGQVDELYRDLGWEIGGHSLNHDLLPSLSLAEAQASIITDWQNLKAMGWNPQSFALPFGYCPQAFYPTLNRHYKYLRGSSDFPMICPLNYQGLGYLPWQSDWEAATAKDRVLRGVSRGENLVIIGFHTFDLGAKYSTIDCDSGEFRSFLQWLKSHDITVLTLREAMVELQ